MIKFFIDRLSADRVRAYALVVIVINLLLMGVSFATTKNGQSLFGTRLGGDFPAFYIAGKIANQRGWNAAYDTDLHFKIYHQMFPQEPPTEDLPYVNPPFLLPLFAVFAFLPYKVALALWLLFSASLYVSGIWLVVRTSSIPTHLRRTAGLLCLSFAPFIIYCWAWGQLAAIGVFSIALAIYFEKQHKVFLSGCTLSLCAYKPVLLFALGPMLLLTKRFRALGGLLMGSAPLAALSWLLIGWEGIKNYAILLETFRRWKSTAETIFQTWLYVDIQSFFHPYMRYSLVSALKFSVLALGIVALLFVWLKVKDRSLVWAITLALSLLLNIYSPIYDCSLLAISALLVADWSYAHRGSLSLQFQLILVALWVLPWGSQALAHKLGIQIYTLIIALFAIYAISLTRRHSEAPVEVIDQVWPASLT